MCIRFDIGMNERGRRVTPSVLRPKPTTKSCHEHRVCVIMHVIEGVDKFLVA